MKRLYLLSLVFLSISCKPQKNDLFVLDPRTLAINPIYISEIADDVKYLALDNSFSFGDIYSFKILDSSIYISTKEYGLLEFNRKGKFVRKFGARGRGPGEYHYFWKFAVDPRSKSVYILDFNVVKVYSKTGQFLRNLSLKEIDQEYFSDLCFYNDKLFISNYIVRGQSNYSWLFLDTSGVIIKKKHNPIPAFNTNMESTGGNFLFHDNIFYWDLYNDTVYSISQDLSYKPLFLFSPGDYKYPKFPVNGITEVQSILPKFYRIDLILETTKNRIITIQGDYVLIDKKTKKSSLSSSTSDRRAGGIINDLDGGSLFRPEYYFTENDREYLLALLNPSELKSYIASVMLIVN